MRLFFLIIGLLTSLLANAQDPAELDQGDVRDAEVVIEKDRKITLPQERKLYEFIKWSPERKISTPKPNVFNKYEYHLVVEPQEFKAARPPKSKKQSDYLHYLKAGFGNYTSPLIDLSLNSPGNANSMVGLNFKHESFGSGAVDGKNSASATNQVNVYGIYNLDKVNLGATASFQSDLNYFYGYDEGTVVNRDNIKHTNNFFNIGLTIEDSYQDDNVDYSIGVGFRGYSDNYSAKENALVLDADLGIGKFKIENELVVSKYEDELSRDRNYFRTNPYYRFQLDKLTLDAGISVSLQNDNMSELSKLKVFPYLFANYEVSDNVNAFAKLDGGYDFNSMYGFALENPYLNPNAVVLNTEKTFDLSLGLGVNPSQKFFANLELGFQSVKFLPMYRMRGTIVTNGPVPGFNAGYMPIYDSGNVGIFTVGLNSTFIINPSNSIKAGFDYYKYSMDDFDQPYHRPNLVFGVKGDHQLVEKLNVNWAFELINGLKGYDPTNSTDISLDAIPKLDLSISYQIKEKWGVFLAGQNLIGNEFSIFYRYPQRGLQIKGGINIRL